MKRKAFNTQVIPTLLSFPLLTLFWANSVKAQETIRIGIGTQNTTTNTVTGGVFIQNEGLLQKYLPKDGKYAGVKYDIIWKNFTSGPPLTNEMVANKLDIGMMGDFPLTVNGITFAKDSAKTNVKSLFVGVISGSPDGAGNAVVVPKESDVYKLADLKGKVVSVPFGSAAHGMLLQALLQAGIDPEKDLILTSQSPEVGGTSLQTKKVGGHANFVPFGELFPFRGFARKIYDGVQQDIPTFHGVVVRSDFADKYPELVVAYLKALLDAQDRVKKDPVSAAAKVEEWTGIEKEVAYMFLGPGGVQTQYAPILPVWRGTVERVIGLLQKLGGVEKTVNSSEFVSQFVEEKFIRQAYQEMGKDYDAVIKTYPKNVITGNDALTNEPITDPRQAGEIWLKDGGIRSYGSLTTLMQDLQKLEQANKEVLVIYTTDQPLGIKLLADQAFYGKNNKGEIAAFLLRDEAEKFAGATPMTFTELKTQLTAQVSTQQTP